MINRNKFAHILVIFAGIGFAVMNSIIGNWYNLIIGFGLMIYALGNYWREERVEELERKLKSNGEN